MHALIDEVFLDLGIILDDTVMDNGEILRLGIMRMGIHRRGFSVGSPTGMSNTYRTCDILVGAEILQICHLSFGLIDIEVVPFVDQGDTC